MTNKQFLVLLLRETASDFWDKILAPTLVILSFILLFTPGVILGALYAVYWWEAFAMWLSRAIYSWPAVFTTPVELFLLFSPFIIYLCTNLALFGLLGLLDKRRFVRKPQTAPINMALA